MNPWVIVGLLVALAGAAGGGFWFGDSHGINKQKAIDQAQFDKINNDLAEQTRQANEQYKVDQANIINLMHAADHWKTKLEIEHAQNQKATDDLRRKYAGDSLRFATGQDSIAGNCSGSAQGTQADSGVSGGATIVQLPDSLAGALRQLAEDADRLKDWYRKAYDYSQQIGDYCQ